MAASLYAIAASFAVRIYMANHKRYSAGSRDRAGADSCLYIVGSGELIEDDNLVQFHLLYTGQLHSSGGVAEKLAIRRTFHGQLQRLWLTNPNLRRIAEQRGRIDYAHEINENHIPDPPALSTEDAIRRGFSVTGKNWNRHGFNYAPLVTSEFCLRCKLDILFLRVEEKDYVLQGGDIDGRLKTLFDGLRMAREANELPRGAVQSQDEDPLFCLLENDDLVSEVSVVTGQLLALPDSKQISKSDVYLQIAVQLNSVFAPPCE